MRVACDRFFGKHVDIAWVPELSTLYTTAHHGVDSSLLHFLVPGDTGTAWPSAASQAAAQEAGVQVASLPGSPFRCGPAHDTPAIRYGPQTPQTVSAQSAAGAGAAAASRRVIELLQ